MARFFVGITGASGHAYAARLLERLTAAGHDVDVAATGAGRKVLAHEQGVPNDGPLSDRLEDWLGAQTAARVRAFEPDRVEAPPSSGTALTGAVILCPCSMGTLARVAAGFSSNLVERAADVALKEGRTLVVVPRESPLSELHLENLLRLARLGAAIVPAMPGFYHHPRGLDDLVDHVVGKVLDRIGVDDGRSRRWGEGDEPEPEAGTSR